MAAGDIITISEDAGGRKGNYYDGVDDYVLHDAHAVARVAANDTLGTYTAWIYLDDITGTILTAGDNDSANEYLVLESSVGRLSVQLKHGGATQFSVRETTGSLVLNKWTHVAVVQNGTRPVLYINGLPVAMTDSTSTDLTFWYDELTNVDKFAIGVFESNGTHTADFTGAIGQVKYWSLGLEANEILAYYKLERGDFTSAELTAEIGSGKETLLNAALQFNVTYENDGITDSGLGADNGTLTGNAHYGGVISDHSYTLAANVTGHAAEDMNTVIDGSKYVTVIRRGD